MWTVIILELWICIKIRLIRKGCAAALLLFCLTAASHRLVGRVQSEYTTTSVYYRVIKNCALNFIFATGGVGAYHFSFPLEWPIKCKSDGCVLLIIIYIPIYGGGLVGGQWDAFYVDFIDKNRVSWMNFPRQRFLWLGFGISPYNNKFIRHSDWFHNHFLLESIFLV